ncbi:ShlB/FhaC/HecB family hemolysin secretion/activation protein [Noviherbaspirillum cavernae]|uniref:ShlB/FhaC/HecB family hemolysin secretion/activation protein n=1 Tax=Noviherbaspirillum cavernae TaxID=2320862 RepID=UPI0013143CE2|nr:ShlB/FhaC/HecB family hemolysin secretion/activation protein [Noviherbaspirillum cavernae]
MLKNQTHIAMRRVPLAALALLLAQTAAFAAEAPITPGSVQDTLRDDRLQRPATPPQVVLPAQPAPSPHDPKAKRFRVNAFAMSGNTVYKERRLKRLLERFVDLELNLYDLSKAADTITAYYHRNGYTLARAFIPAQKIENGVVRLQIVEGRIGKVTFDGNKRYSTDFLAARTGLLTPGSLVTTDRLENNLLLLNDLPGLRAKVILEPGAEFGASDAEIKIEERLFTGYVSLNNFGRSETGQKRVEPTLNINSPFGWGDQLSLSGSVSEHRLVRYWKANYSLPLNTVGTRLSVGSSKVAYDVTGPLAALGVTGELSTDEVVIGHPLVRSRDDNQQVSVGVRRNQLTQSALGTTLFDNSLNVLTAAYQISRIHRDTSITNASFGLVTNFKSSNDSIKQDAVHARLELDVNHTTPFIRQWDLYLRGNIVYSKERLPDTEKFSLGGPGSVRAFRPAEVRGDSGALVTAELRHPFSIARSLGFIRLTADVGEATYKAPGFSDNKDRLRSVGAGATIYPGKGLIASVDVATPVGSVRDGLGDGKNHRIWVNISASF